MPAPVTTEGETAPDQSIDDAPPPLLPVEKNVTVSGAPDPEGKSTLATGETEPGASGETTLPSRLKPAAERATLVRVYKV